MPMMRREWLARLDRLRAADGRLCVEGRADAPPPLPAQAGPSEFDTAARHRPPAAHPRRPAAASGRHRRRRCGPRPPDRRASGDRPSAAGPRGDGLQRRSRGCACVSCARVRNVIATIPGRAPGTQLLINAHYDSTPTGPGAWDDGLGVATMLEVGSTPEGNRRRRGPVTLLFNEGEEYGLNGAAAFVRRDPLAKQVNSLINIDYARGHGPGADVRDQRAQRRRDRGSMRGATRRPYANSISTDFAKLIPNTTDVVEIHAGAAGRCSTRASSATRRATIRPATPSPRSTGRASITSAAKCLRRREPCRTCPIRRGRAPGGWCSPTSRASASSACR